MRTIAILLAACGALALGACGSSDKKSDSGSSSGSAPTTTQAATTADVSTTAKTANTTVDASVQAAVDACKQSISAAPTLKDDVKADLTKLCDKAASGDAAEVKKISKEVCLKIVDGSGIPAGDAKTQAEAACNSVG